MRLKYSWFLKWWREFHRDPASAQGALVSLSNFRKYGQLTKLTKITEYKNCEECVIAAVFADRLLNSKLPREKDYYT